jgi:endonuclease YncB( thermonuclease family)
VIDGDTIRIRHAPPALCPDNFSDGRGCEEGRRLTDCTIIVRLYGVDAPETSGGRADPTGQPYSREARDYVVDAAYGEMARVKLLGRDRYNRVVGRVTIGNAPFEEDLSRGLLLRGYASLYTGGGARYDGRRDELERNMATARDERRGIWRDGVAEFVDPAAYRREMKTRRHGNGR